MGTGGRGIDPLVDQSAPKDQYASEMQGLREREKEDTDREREREEKRQYERNTGECDRLIEGTGH